MKTPFVRAAHLKVYADVLHKMGAPVNRHLAAAGLPPFSEEDQEQYLCVPRVLDFVSKASRDASVIELGFLAAQKSDLSTLSPAFQRALLAAPNGLQRLRQVLRFDRVEDGALRSAVIRRSGFLRVICNLEDFRGSDALAYSEWLQIQGMVSIVRSVAGSGWCPPEVTFISGEKCSPLARESFGNARMLFAQPNTSILVPLDILARPCADADSATQDPGRAGMPENLVSFLKKAIRPHLAGASPGVCLAAEWSGMSRRSFQRKLARLDRSYSEVLAEVRYETAAALLSNSTAKIIEIAYETGYENPEHFSRAFRRMAGISPREYRKSLSHR
ncbi:Arabinose-binding domain of AraC transcription regulator, N-term [Cribrihabitans marinus]|uniref:Arabinose-binding domain of AraC transcription regulator, N-term n=1 Tax=Cribrihabitans marinus TaxID=1227549 RepID=A0A1H7E6Q0_9RHOB|nr:AraC family transcriptional regulator [Cribrihabitans marinus]GGH41616.1 hypothetical protein GCM10010973_38660 [Cribrihabitans marinus]SEK07752.1 Arabinose-binding domain of AraC transcription regulator, N-term [Cribrihabitans marinus]